MGGSTSKPKTITVSHQEFNSNPDGSPQLQRQQHGAQQSGAQQAVNNRLMQLLGDSDDEHPQGGGNVQVVRMSPGQPQGGQPQDGGNVQVVRMSAAPGQPQHGNTAHPQQQQMMFAAQPAAHAPAPQQQQGIYGSSTANTNNQDIYGSNNVYGK